MPGFDRTGPGGMGPRTGRGMGPCGAGYAWGGRGQGWGRGMGMGAGRGAGMGIGAGRWPWWIQQSDSKENTLKGLETEKAEIDAAIEDLKKSE